jgi:hypothetical protein
MLSLCIPFISHRCPQDIWVDVREYILEHVQTGTNCKTRLVSKKHMPASSVDHQNGQDSRSRLLNLTGFFSRTGGDPSVAGAADICMRVAGNGAGPRQIVCAEAELEDYGGSVEADEKRVWKKNE